MFTPSYKEAQPLDGDFWSPVADCINHLTLKGQYAIGPFSQSISLVIPAQYVLTKAQEANGDRCVIAGLGEAVRLGAMLTRSCYHGIQYVPGAEYKRFMIWVVK